MAETQEGQTQKVEGFIVLNSNGKPLTGQFGWGDLGGEGGVWNRVFTREQVEDILKKSNEEEWEFKPCDVVPAVWDGIKVEKQGDPMSVFDLPPVEVK